MRLIIGDKERDFNLNFQYLLLNDTKEMRTKRERNDKETLLTWLTLSNRSQRPNS